MRKKKNSYEQIETPFETVSCSLTYLFCFQANFIFKSYQAYQKDKLSLSDILGLANKNLSSLSPLGS